MVPGDWCSRGKGRRMPPSLRSSPKHPPVLCRDFAPASHPGPGSSCLALAVTLGSRPPPLWERGVSEGLLEPVFAKAAPPALCSRLASNQR